MANGMILRGEVYWVSLDDSAGSEIRTGRPAVVVSGDVANERENTVIVAFITSGGHASPHNVSIVSPEGKKRVLCRQLRTVDKARLTQYEYKLSGPEMIRVTGALAGSMCIPLKVNESTNLGQENKEITALKAECEMWKRSYDVVMTQLVELKVNSDLALRMARVGYEYEESEDYEEPEEAEGSPEIPVAEELPVVEEPEQKTEESEVVVELEVPAEPEKPVVLEKVNINTATVKEMMEHLGIGQYYAYRISSHRNKNGKFVSVEELELVEGLAKDFYERYGDRCTIGEPEPVEEPEQPEEQPEPQTEVAKLNVNTASAQEISDVTGWHLNNCYSITGKRKRDGLFKSLDEIVTPPRISEKMLDRARHLLTVGEDEEPEEEPESGKVNINTASLRELMAVGFEKRAAALIVNERKKYGRFRSLDDLTAIPEISGKILRKLRDDLEV